MKREGVGTRSRVPNFGGAGYVRSTSFSPDGRRIVSGDSEGTVKVWDTATGAEMLTLRGHTMPVNKVALSLDGSRIISTDSSGKELLWNSETGNQVFNEWIPAIQERYTATENGLLRISRFRRPDPLLIRTNPNHDPWAENTARREYWAPIYHEQNVIDAEKREDWFAARFHLRWLVKNDPENNDYRERLANAEVNYTPVVLPAIAQEPY